jgi:hypothetical protein
MSRQLVLVMLLHSLKTFLLLRVSEQFNVMETVLVCPPPPVPPIEVIVDPIHVVIRDFVCPEGWVKVEPLSPVTEEESKRGVNAILKEPTQLHKNGVIVERDKSHASYAALTSEEKSQRRFYCMVTQACRDTVAVLRISTKANSTAVAHVKLESHKPYRKWDETVKESSTKLNATKVSNRVAATLSERDGKVFKTDKRRFYILNSVKDIIVGRMLPFSFWESEDVKHHYSIVNPDFPSESLHNKAVKHALLEFYSYLTATIRAEVAETRAGSPKAFITANLDLWTSKVSKGVYIGEFAPTINLG